MNPQIIVAFVVGLLFSAGLCLSGMTLPQNIIGFLWLGDWKPALMLVMIGATAVYMVCLRLTLRRGKPMFAAKFELPTNRRITWQLVGGAALFGIGWGLGGYCGGPALASLVAGHIETLVFLVTMFAGMYASKVLIKT